MSRAVVPYERFLVRMPSAALTAMCERPVPPLPGPGECAYRRATIIEAYECERLLAGSGLLAARLACLIVGHRFGVEPRVVARIVGTPTWNEVNCYV